MSVLDVAHEPAVETRVRITIENSGRSFDCAPGDTLLAGALRAGVGIAYECSSGGCGSCKVELVEGDLEVTRTGVAGLKDRDFDRGKRLACVSRPLSDCVIRVREDAGSIPTIVPARRTGVLVARFPLTHDLWEFRFKVEGDARFLPGQYALLELPDAGCVRAYSMANIPGGDPEWHFQIKRVPGGVSTTALFDHLAIGDGVKLDGPFSTSHLREDAPRDIVCIAGGSGLAPMLSIVRGALASPHLADRKIYLFYGGREPRDIVDTEHFGPLPGLGERVHYLPVISSTESEGILDWKGPTGFVHQFVAEHLDQPYDSYEFYTAGPPPMVEAVRRMLILEKSTPANQVHYDRFF